MHLSQVLYRGLNGQEIEFGNVHNDVTLELMDIHSAMTFSEINILTCPFKIGITGISKKLPIVSNYNIYAN